MNKLDAVKIDQLIEELGSPDGLIRQQARISLVQTGRPVVEPLIEMLENNRTGHIHWEAAKALSQIGSLKSAQAMVELLQDNDLGVRWLGAEGLIAIGEDSLEPLLTALLYNPGSILLRQGAHHVRPISSP